MHALEKASEIPRNKLGTIPGAQETYVPWCACLLSLPRMVACLKRGVDLAEGDPAILILSEQAAARPDLSLRGAKRRGNPLVHAHKRGRLPHLRSNFFRFVRTGLVVGGCPLQRRQASHQPKRFSSGHRP
jgi:hypothetical protein